MPKFPWRVFLLAGLGAIISIWSFPILYFPRIADQVWVVLTVSYWISVVSLFATLAILWSRLRRILFYLWALPVGGRKWLFLQLGGFVTIFLILLWKLPIHTLAISCLLLLQQNPFKNISSINKGLDGDIGE